MELHNFRLVIFAVLGLLLIGKRQIVIDARSTTTISNDYDYTDSSIDMDRTYVSSVEKVLMGLLIPIKIVNHTAQGVQYGLERIISHLPSFVQKGLSIVENHGTRNFGDILNTVADKFRAIYPGTLWCGGGDIADNDEDLGFFNNTDACCREHDHCSMSIPGQEGRYGLLNNGIFTRSHCSCDKEFHECLRDANNIIATKIGITYFNILRLQCFKKDYPIVKCDQQDTLRVIDRKCLEYVRNTNVEQKEQWFDNPDF